MLIFCAAHCASECLEDLTFAAMLAELAVEFIGPLRNLDLNVHGGFFFFGGGNNLCCLRGAPASPMQISCSSLVCSGISGAALQHCH